MDEIRISYFKGEDYDSFVIHDVERFMGRLRNDPRVAQRYKDMDFESFKAWADNGVTPKQYEKLQALNTF